VPVPRAQLQELKAIPLRPSIGDINKDEYMIAIIISSAHPAFSHLREKLSQSKDIRKKETAYCFT